MTTEIVRREPVATLPEKMEWARALATSNLLPRQYQNNPGNLLFAVEYADALGVSRINAITSIHVIEGKPSASADLIASLVRRAGHKLRVMGDDTYAEAHLIRADDPEFTYKARWDMAKARAAGLLGKSVWKSYPGAMLRSRAITEVARMGASDSLFGVIYTPEELGVETDADGEVVHQISRVPQPSQSAADRVRQAIQSAPGAPQTGDAEGSPAETSVAEGEAGSSPAGNPSASSAADGITAGQLKKMGAAMREAGLTAREPALAFVAKVIGREVSSRNDLTKDEAGRVIDALERGAAVKDPAAGPDEDVVDAELVPDQPSDDPEVVWQQIRTVAEQQGMSLEDVREDFPARMGGLLVDEASAGELSTYLQLLGQEPAA